MSPKTGEKTLDYYMGLPYKVEVAHDEDGWFARVIDLPGCMTWADTFEDLRPMIEDAKRGWIQDALEYGDPVPEPRTAKDFSGKVNLRMPKSLHRDLARQAEEEGVSLNQLMVSYLARGTGDSSSASKVTAIPPRGDKASAQQEESAEREEVLKADQISSRDWPQEVRRVMEEYEELLGEGDLTLFASARIVTDSTNLLLDLSDELTSISDQAVEISNKLVADTKKRRYSPKRLQELDTAFDNLKATFYRLSEYFKKLEEFCQRAIQAHKDRFGDQRPEDLSMSQPEEAYSPVAEAEMHLRNASTNFQRTSHRIPG